MTTIASIIGYIELFPAAVISFYYYSILTLYSLQSTNIQRSSILMYIEFLLFSIDLNLNVFSIYLDDNTSQVFLPQTKKLSKMFLDFGNTNLVHTQEYRRSVSPYSP